MDSKKIENAFIEVIEALGNVEYKEELKEKMGFKSNSFTALFGGNMGKPQKLENVLYLAEKCKEIKEINFLLIGNGSEKNRIKELARVRKIDNIFFREQVSREEYEKLAYSCDVGLVSLDDRFTVPNFPSKTTDYFKIKLPIFAILDECSASYLGLIPSAIRPKRLIRVIFHAGDQVTSTETVSMPSICFRDSTISMGTVSVQSQAVSVKVMTILQWPVSSRLIS